MTRLFELNGIKAPGKVDLYKIGVINLVDLSDDQAIEIYKQGCPFLRPTAEGMKVLYPDQNPIEVKTFQTEKKPVAGKKSGPRKSKTKK